MPEPEPALPHLDIGLLVFPKLTQLDMTGPYEVFHRMPGARVHLIAATLDAQISEHGLPIQPTTTYAACPPLDALVVPGGFGVNALLNDVETIEFVRRQAESASYLGSVCTGSLILGAAGLLQGVRATSHWMSRDFLAEFGAIPTAQRVVVDGRVFTGGGITAGIDFALTMVAEIRGTQVAQEIQLAMEYDPSPPFDAGSPAKAEADVVASLRAKWAPHQDERRRQVLAAAGKLSSNAEH
ncbi:MAG: DJ-1/PfpI family protein [Acidobacteriota bacterium]